MTKHNALIIIPTYNEAENLEPLISEILARTNEFDILVIDDNSPDGTGEIADRLAKEWISVHIIHRAGKMGLGTAYVEGFKWALARDYKYVLQMDCDFSHHPRYLPTFLEKITSADVVIGSRYVNNGGTLNWGLLRKFISKGGNNFARFMLGLKTHDCTGGFRCYRRGMLRRLPWEKIRLEGYGFQVGSVHQVEFLGGQVSEFPIIFEDRRVGKSKMSFKIVVEAFTYVMWMALFGAIISITRSVPFWGFSYFLSSGQHQSTHPADFSSTLSIQEPDDGSPQVSVGLNRTRMKGRE